MPRSLTVEASEPAAPELEAAAALPLAASLGSGLLLALCFPKPGLSPLAWLALAPLLWAARRESPGRAAWLGWLAGAAFFALSLHWIYFTCRFAGVAAPLALFAWGLLAAFEALPWALFGAGSAYAARLPAPGWPWACAALWAAIEFACARWTPRVGADVLGYTQWRYLSWIEPSSLFGPHALGFLIVLVNAGLAGWLRERRARPPAAALGAAALAGLWWACGLASLAMAGAPAGLQQTVAVLQPDIDQYRKWDARESAEIRATFDRLLGEALKLHPVLVLWPESSVPGWLEDPENFGWLSSLARRGGVAQLVGTLTAEDGGKRNAAALIDPMGRVRGLYEKRELVPFGEYVPWRRVLARRIGILAQMGDLTPGPARQPPIETPIGPVGVTLCYEAVFPRLTRASVEGGARVIANLTNDGWYKDTWGPWQHFYANRFRAIENRVYLIRAGNTGISAVIDPWGRVTSMLGLMRQGVLAGTIPSVDPFPRRSFYARHGDWFGWLAIFATALFGLGARRAELLQWARASSACL